LGIEEGYIAEKQSKGRYIMGTYLEKIRKRKKIREKFLREELRAESRRLIQLLETKGFKFKRIYLFGSLVKDKSLAPWSDIDLAIEGLSRTMFYKAYACLLKNSKFPVDLKPFENLETAIKEKIKKEGEVVYE
jgi:predicted nucleotidyltransferase